LHYPTNTTQTGPVHQILATTIHKSNTTPHHQKMERQPTTPPTKRGATTSGFPPSGRRDSGPVASKPNSVSDDVAPAVSPAGTQCLSRTRTPTHYR
jgi:hypothetical protein